MIASLVMSGAIFIDDREYPKLLKNIKNPPEKLYYKGELTEGLFDYCLAVVGSRRMSAYGRLVTEKLLTEISFSGITVVSGFMYGIDSTAHRTAVDTGMRTVAILPSGIEYPYPTYQKQLYEDILCSKGLIISEIDGKVAPSTWSFPKRNRLVAGICKAVLVVEAELKSGSLITADLARKYGRKIFAVPGNITSDTSLGTIELLKGGATAITSGFDILSCLGGVQRGRGGQGAPGSVPGSLSSDRVGQASKRAGKTEMIDSAELPLFDPPKSRKIKKDRSEELTEDIISLISRGPLDIDRICRQITGDIPGISSLLTLLVLEGRIREEGGLYYVN